MSNQEYLTSLVVFMLQVQWTHYISMVAHTLKLHQGQICPIEVPVRGREMHVDCGFLECHFYLCVHCYWTSLQRSPLFPLSTTWLSHLLLVDCWFWIQPKRFNSLCCLVVRHGQFDMTFCFLFLLLFIPDWMDIFNCCVPFISTSKKSLWIIWGCRAHEKHYTSSHLSVPGNPFIPYSPKRLLCTTHLLVVRQMIKWSQAHQRHSRVRKK